MLQFFFSQSMKKLQGFLESEEQPSVREQLLRLNQYYIAEMKWMVSLLSLSFQFYAVAARQRTVRQFLKRYFKDYREVLAALVQRGIDRGSSGGIEDTLLRSRDNPWRPQNRFDRYLAG